MNEAAVATDDDRLEVSGWVDRGRKALEIESKFTTYSIRVNDVYYCNEIINGFGSRLKDEAFIACIYRSLREPRTQRTRECPGPASEVKTAESD